MSAENGETDVKMTFTLSVSKVNKYSVICWGRGSDWKECEHHSQNAKTTGSVKDLLKQNEERQLPTDQTINHCKYEGKPNIVRYRYGIVSCDRFVPKE
jgi:hypothetical protein